MNGINKYNLQHNSPSDVGIGEYSVYVLFTFFGFSLTGNKFILQLLHLLLSLHVKRENAALKNIHNLSILYGFIFYYAFSIILCVGRFNYFYTKRFSCLLRFIIFTHTKIAIDFMESFGNIFF